MNATAIIAEYNPFHNGHKYQIDRVREMFPENSIVVIMSGDFVQRGEPAILDKHYRARMALECGADLVLELPLPRATSSAQFFAEGGVFLANATGVVDSLAFGAETDDLEILKRIADISLDEDFILKIKDTMSAFGCTYAEALTRTVKSAFNRDTSDILNEPNNVLAVEYLKAIKKIDSPIKPVLIQRVGCTHDSSDDGGIYRSASELRRMIHEQEDIYRYIPGEVFNILSEAVKDGRAPTSFSRLELSVLADLRRQTAADFLNVPDVSEGIENRILAAAGRASSLDELYNAVKTKRYTHARIRRIILAKYLGITRSDVLQNPPYIRVLGFNDRGRELLGEIRKHQRAEENPCPIVTKYADAKRAGETAQRAAELESRSVDLFNLTLPGIRESGTDMTDGIIMN